MPVKSRTKFHGDHHKRQFVFETTPEMATFLFSWVVGELDVVYDEYTASDGSLKKLRIFSGIGKRDQSDEALRLSLEFVHEMEDYTGFPLPLPKLDIVTVEKFGMAAMENWGLILISEFILINKDAVSYENKWVLQLLANQISQQWTSNIVTAPWWDYIWLSYGYAVFMEFYLVDRMRPEYRIWSTYNQYHRYIALENDYLNSSLPIQLEVKNPAGEEHDYGLKHSKGAAVIRMLHEYVGETSFMTGMQIHLNMFRHGNAVPDDLWNTIEQVTSDSYYDRKPVREMMNTWTTQSGFPNLKVSNLIVDASKQTVTLELTQEKFTNEDVLEGPEKEKLWDIPVTFTIGTSPFRVHHVELMTERTLTVTLKNVVNPETNWIFVNHEGTGLYRVEYSPKLMDRLILGVRSMDLSPPDRFVLLDDLISAVSAGKASTYDLLTLLPAYIDETEGSVWSAVSAGVSFLYRNVPHEYLPHLQKYILKEFSKIKDTITWEIKPEENHDEIDLKINVLQRLIYAGDKSVQLEGKNLFEDELAGRAIVNPELRRTMYIAALSLNEEDTLQKIFDIYSEGNFSHQNAIPGAFGCLRNEDLARKTLEFALEDGIRISDIDWIFYGIASAEIRKDFAWEFMKDNWDKIKERFNSKKMNPEEQAEILVSTTIRFKTEEEIEKIHKFCEEGNKCEGMEKRITTMIDTLRARSKSAQKNNEGIRKYFKEHADEYKDVIKGTPDEKGSMKNEVKDDNTDENDESILTKIVAAIKNTIGLEGDKVISTAAGNGPQGNGDNPMIPNSATAKEFWMSKESSEEDERWGKLEPLI